MTEASTFDDVVYVNAMWQEIRHTYMWCVLWEFHLCGVTENPALTYQNNVMVAEGYEISWGTAEPQSFSPDNPYRALYALAVERYDNYRSRQ